MGGEGCMYIVYEQVCVWERYVDMYMYTMLRTVHMHMYIHV